MGTAQLLLRKGQETPNGKICHGGKMLLPAMLLSVGSRVCGCVWKRSLFGHPLCNHQIGYHLNLGISDPTYKPIYGPFDGGWIKAG